ESGVIKSIGVSNYEVYHLAELLEYAKHRPAVNQFEFHPYFTRPTLIQYCLQNGISVQAFSSLVRGNKEILDEPAVNNWLESLTFPRRQFYTHSPCALELASFPDL
ncbi:hypothetical protein OSTOST_24489, partial [Ostertagia ostertagi]